MEAEAANINTWLTTAGVGRDQPLVDAEGYFTQTQYSRI